jgi:hypothetical protein
MCTQPDIRLTQLEQASLTNRDQSGSGFLDVVTDFANAKRIGHGPSAVFANISKP